MTPINDSRAAPPHPASATPQRSVAIARILLLLYTLIGPALAGGGALVALTLGVFEVRAILLAAAMGFALGVPCAWAVMRQLTRHSGA